MSSTSRRAQWCTQVGRPGGGRGGRLDGPSHCWLRRCMSHGIGPAHAHPCRATPRPLQAWTTRPFCGRRRRRQMW